MQVVVPRPGMGRPDLSDATTVMLLCDVILADAMWHLRSTLLRMHQADCLPYSASFANSHASTRAVARKGTLALGAIKIVCSRVPTPHKLADEPADLHQLPPLSPQ